MANAKSGRRTDRHADTEGEGDRDTTTEGQPDIKHDDRQTGDTHNLRITYTGEQKETMVYANYQQRVGILNFCTG